MNCLMQAWQRHERELRGWVTRRVGDGHEAEDVLQDVFVKAMRQGAGFCALRNPRAWLFEVARNAVADRFRSAREAVELPEDLPAEPQPERATVDRLAESCLARVLSELGAEDREAITLCDLQGVTQQEFARRKGLTLPGAKSRVQRARKRLRERMLRACRVRVDADGRVSDFVPRTIPP